MVPTFKSIDCCSEEMGKIAVGVYDKGQHIGLLHRMGERSTVHFLHLCWHEILRNNGGVEKCKIWISPSIETEAAELVAGQGRLILARSRAGKIPYGFSSPAGFFGPSGEKLPGETRCGLTCATFVLAVFHLAGTPLVIYQDWPSRTSDSIWQNLIIEQLRGGGVPEEHLEAISKEVGQVRYRPLEVAGAVSAKAYPVEFRTAEILATSVSEALV